MNKVYRDLTILALVTILITFLIWIPHFLKFNSLYGLNFSHGFQTIYQNFDGLEYVIIAKTFYNPQAILSLPSPLPPNYFASHFPGYPIMIFLFAPILGYLKSMLFVSILFTILSVFIFYFLVRDFKLTEHPLWLSFLFLVLPARWVIIHSVGSPEPLFIFLTLSSVYFFGKFLEDRKKISILLCAIFASLAQATRPPGILLAVGLLIFVLYTTLKKKGFNIIRLISDYYFFLLVPLTIIGIFLLFQISFGDFYAYFHSGDNIHLTFPPFQVFNKNQFWVGEIWLEDIIYIFILGLLTGLLLLKSKIPFTGFFVLTYLLATFFVVHRDISRYVVPIYPFMLIAFEKVLNQKEFKIVIFILLLAIYLYSQNFILNNTAPIPNLGNYN